MEEEIGSLYKVIDDAILTKAELEEQMENMRAELRNLEHDHEQVPPKHTPFHLQEAQTTFTASLDEFHKRR